MAIIEITSLNRIDEKDLQFDHIHATGPGGQNVNKTASAVQLRFDLRNSRSLEPEVKERLIKLAGSRVTEDGIIIIEARQYRTQAQNRRDAIQRLAALIRKAIVKPKLRQHTRPSLAAKAVRINHKKKRGELKRVRRSIPMDWE